MPKMEQRGLSQGGGSTRPQVWALMQLLHESRAGSPLDPAASGAYAEGAGPPPTHPMLISIFYDSGFDHTARQANAVAEGIAQVPDAQARLIAVADQPVQWDVLEASDAIAFGSPTHNSSASARLKQFMEDSTRPA